MPKILHNPTSDATIDTMVEGVNYVIEPGETKDNIPDSHALDLVKRYEFLEVVEDGAVFEDEEENGPEDGAGNENQPAAEPVAPKKAAAKKTAKKAAVKKVAAKGK